jgi:putative transposase
LPPYSPDLNPIEKYWALLKKKVKLLVKNGVEFIKAINEGLRETQNFRKA